MLWASAADSGLGFLLADFKVRTDAVVLFLADERPHFRFTFEWRTKLDAFGLFGHRFDKFRINLLFNEDAASGGTDLALIDENAEERAVHRSFPIGVREKDVGRLAAEFEGHALERVRGALDDDLADSGASGKSDFVHTGMRYERRARGFAEAINDVDDSGRQAGFFKIIRTLERGKRRLFGRLQYASTTRRNCGCQLPRGHK